MERNDRSDLELVAAARAGTSQAFTDLVRRHGSRVWGLLWSRTRRRADVEDLTQETFLRAYRQLPTLQHADRFAGWLLSIAARTWSDWHRAKARNDVGLEALEVEPQQPALESTSDRDALLSAVASLPEPLRDTLVQFHFGGKSYRELAALFDVTEAAINARLTKARQLLRERLENRMSDHG
ncbi:MAG: sigma-70 family RNA polymerase sigma factor [Planctomycetes bacterium]|nr:sigma-70 family RNA polymerase sigma factor [Planctomycetota bacterium]MCC7169332.1 sigma-70 family RNA polymerase sigma factor [Planctomycetota bacterium]